MQVAEMEEAMDEVSRQKTREKTKFGVAQRPCEAPACIINTSPLLCTRQSAKHQICTYMRKLWVYLVILWSKAFNSCLKFSQNNLIRSDSINHLQRTINAIETKMGSYNAYIFSLAAFWIKHCDLPFLNFLDEDQAWKIGESQDWGPFTDKFQRRCESNLVCTTHLWSIQGEGSSWSLWCPQISSLK